MKHILALIVTILFLACSSAQSADVTLAWDAVTIGEPTEYVIYVRAFGTTEWTAVTNRIPVSGNATETATIPIGAGRWEIAVTARNVAGESGMSNVVDTGDRPPPPPKPVPNPPANLRITVIVDVIVP